MIIKDFSSHEIVGFDVLECGNIFKFDGEIFLKVGNPPDAYNAYDFKKGRLTGFSGDTVVFSIPSELTLHERGWRQGEQN